MSFRTIGIDYTPRVVFQDSPKPLISRQAQLGKIPTGPARANDILQQPKPHTASSTSNAISFSINDLAPASRQQYPTSYQPIHQPPTPPPDDNDDDGAMDWTPSQQSTLRPATLYRPLPPAVEQPHQNPFRGHLPADVVSQEHRLRNPPNKPTFRKASENTKQNFFKTPKRNVRDFDNASDAGTEYEPSLADNLSPGPRFADAKLRLQSEHTPVTGLERLLANAFSLNDEPPEIRAAQEGHVQAGHHRETLTNGGYAQWHRLPVFLFLMALYFLWTNTLKPSLAAYEAQLQLATLFVAALASIRSLFLALRKDMAAWSGSDILIFTAEFAASMALILTIGSSYEDSDWNANHRTLETAGSTLMAILSVQELWLFSQDVRNALRSTRTPLAPTSAPDPAPLAALSDPRQQLPTRRIEGSATHHITSAVAQAGADQPRPTRSWTNYENRAIPGSGFGGLSLGESHRKDQLVSMDSLSLGGPLRQNRNGMR